MCGGTVIGTHIEGGGGGGGETRTGKNSVRSSAKRSVINIFDFRDVSRCIVRILLLFFIGPHTHTHTHARTHPLTSTNTYVYLVQPHP